MKKFTSAPGTRRLHLLLLVLSLNGIHFFLNSCAPTDSNHSLSERNPQNAQTRNEWMAYKSVSPFVPFRMWALSLPYEGKGSPSCVSDKIFAELETKIENADRINASISDPVIHRHIQETVDFWTQVIRDQPALKKRVDHSYTFVEGAATETRDFVYENSSGGVVARGHLAGIGGLSAAFGGTLRVDREFRPHVARYAPYALELAKLERELDRKYRYRGDPNHLLDQNIEELEKTVSEIRN